MNLLERVERGMFDRVEVLDADGDEREVFNHVSVEQSHYVTAGQVEAGAPHVYAGDAIGGPEPDAVTPDIDEWLQDEFGVDVRGRGIDVIDPTAEEVDVR